MGVCQRDLVTVQVTVLCGCLLCVRPLLHETMFKDRTADSRGLRRRCYEKGGRLHSFPALFVRHLIKLQVVSKLHFYSFTFFTLIMADVMAVSRLLFSSPHLH